MLIEINKIRDVGETLKDLLLENYNNLKDKAEKGKHSCNESET